jgi:hypothetical protein
MNINTNLVILGFCLMLVSLLLAILTLITFERKEVLIARHRCVTNSRRKRGEAASFIFN